MTQPSAVKDFRPRTCCLTGHQVIMPWEEKKILTKLRYQVDILLRRGYLYFGVGGARGFDMLAAEYLLDLRTRYKKQIRIISVLPYPDYRKEWNDRDTVRQGVIMRRSDKVVYAALLHMRRRTRAH